MHRHRCHLCGQPASPPARQHASTREPAASPRAALSPFPRRARVSEAASPRHCALLLMISRRINHPICQSVSVSLSLPLLTPPAFAPVLPLCPPDAEAFRPECVAVSPARCGVRTERAAARSHTTTTTTPCHTVPDGRREGAGAAFCTWVTVCLSVFARRGPCAAQRSAAGRNPCV